VDAVGGGGLLADEGAAGAGEFAELVVGGVAGGVVSAGQGAA